MITHFAHNRSSQLVMPLTECPWLKGETVILPGYAIPKYAYQICKGKNVATIIPGVTIACFDSTADNFVIELNYPKVTEDERMQLRTALEAWLTQLYTLQSCVFEPRKQPEIYNDDEWI